MINHADLSFTDSTYKFWKRSWHQFHKHTKSRGRKTWAGSQSSHPPASPVPCMCLRISLFENRRRGLFVAWNISGWPRGDLFTPVEKHLTHSPRAFDSARSFILLTAITTKILSTSWNNTPVSCVDGCGDGMARWVCLITAHRLSPGNCGVFESQNTVMKMAKSDWNATGCPEPDRQSVHKAPHTVKQPWASVHLHTFTVSSSEKHNMNHIIRFYSITVNSLLLSIPIRNCYLQRQHCIIWRNNMNIAIKVIISCIHSRIYSSLLLHEGGWFCN